MPARCSLNVSLTQELTAYVGDCVASGQYRSASEVIREALRHLRQGTPDAINASNQAVLLKFSDRISPLKDPRRIMAEAAFLLGSHLAADRVGYSEISDDGEHATIHDDWVAGDMPSVAGHYRLKDFGAPIIALLRRGSTVTYSDTSAEPLVQVSESVAATFSAIGHRAAIDIPLVKDGRLRAVLFVHQRDPRDWTVADERLAAEVADRTWAAVERARAETALAESEARFRGVFDTAFQLMGLLSPEGLVLEANEAAVSFAGVPRDAIVGRLLWETPLWKNSPDPYASDRLKAAIAEAGAGISVHYEVEVGAAEERSAIVDFSIRPIRDASQSIVLLLPEGRDITVAKRAQEKLAESEARFRTLTDAMPQMIWASDAEGNTIYCNARFLDFLGVTFGVKAIPWRELVHPDDRELSHEMRRQSLITGLPFEREHRLRRYDGVYCWVLARALPLRDATGRIETWFGTSTDITELVEARQVLRQSRDELECLVKLRTRALEDAAHELVAEMRRREEMQTTLLQVQKLEAMGQLTSGVAHDFNNVLTAISGSYSLLRSRTDQPLQLKIIEQGEKAVERAVKLVGQLMSFVRREKSMPRLLDLASMLPEGADLLRHAIGINMRCEVAIAPDIYPVLADPYELDVALLNLAVNARDAMDGEGTIRIAASNLDPAKRPPQLAAGDYVTITVADTGIGMPPEVVARSTETFFTTKPQGQGTGLGLPMVNGFAIRQGGCLRIESTQGVGTNIEIILPRAPIGRAEDGTASAPVADTDLHGDATILLVDNDDRLRQVLATYLRELGYVVLEATSAEVAVALVRTLKRLDLLVTDVLMPIASGPMLALSLRTDWPELPVLFITGGTVGPELAGEMVVPKPFPVAAIAAAILQLLGRWSPAADARSRLMKRLKTPALRRFYLNWQTCSVPGEALPTLAQIDPARFGLGPHSFIVTVDRDDPPVFRFASIGSVLTRRLGRQLDGTLIDDSLAGNDILGELHSTYRRCMRNRTPVYQGARFDFGDGEPLSFERLVLPISEDSNAITHLVGITVFTDKAGQVS
jgi:putative addiction module CopG family antidote